LNTAEKIVDHFASVLLDGQVEPGPRKKLIAYLGGTKFKLTRESVEEKVRGVAHLTMCTPEYQLG
jgi:hypothetical protein